ncbi:hypothetical protein Bhyg_01116, partial [Pseudolycoriella hygida]
DISTESEQKQVHAKMNECPICNRGFNTMSGVRQHWTKGHSIDEINSFIENNTRHTSSIQIAQPSRATDPKFLWSKLQIMNEDVNRPNEISIAGRDKGHDKQVSFSVENIWRNFKKKSCVCKSDPAEDAKWKAGVQQAYDRCKKVSSNLHGRSHELTAHLMNVMEGYITKLIYLSTSNSTLLASGSSTMLEYSKVLKATVDGFNKMVSNLSGNIGKLTHSITETLNCLEVSFSSFMKKFIKADCADSRRKVDYEPVFKDFQKLMNVIALIVETLLNDCKPPTREVQEAVLILRMINEYFLITVQGINACAQDVYHRDGTKAASKRVKKVSDILDYIAVENAQSLESVVFTSTKSVTAFLKHIVNITVFLNSSLKDIFGVFEDYAMLRFVQVFVARQYVKIAQAGHDNSHDQQLSFSVEKILRNLTKKDNCMCKPDSAENIKLKADVQQTYDGCKRASTNLFGRSGELGAHCIKLMEVYITKLIHFSTSNSTMLTSGSSTMLALLSKCKKIDESGFKAIEEFSKVLKAIVDGFNKIVANLSGNIGKLTHSIIETLNSLEVSHSSFMTKFIEADCADSRRKVDYEPVFKEFQKLVNVIALIVETLLNDCKPPTREVQEAVLILCVAYDYFVIAVQGINACAQDVYYRDGTSAASKRVKKVSDILDYIAVETAQSLESVVFTSTKSVKAFLKHIIAQAGHDNGHDQQVSFSVEKIWQNLTKKDNCMCKPDSAENIKLKADVQQTYDGCKRVSTNLFGRSGELGAHCIELMEVYITKLIHFSTSNSTMLTSGSSTMLALLSKCKKIDESGFKAIEEFSKVLKAIVDGFNKIVANLSGNIGKLTHSIIETLNSLEVSHSSFMTKFIEADCADSRRKVDYEPVFKEFQKLVNVIALIVETLLNDCKPPTREVQEAVLILCVAYDYFVIAVQGINACAQDVYYRDGTSAASKRVKKVSDVLDYIAVETAQSLESVVFTSTKSVNAFLKHIVNITVFFNSSLKDIFGDTVLLMSTCTQGLLFGILSGMVKLLDQYAALKEFIPKSNLSASERWYTPEIDKANLDAELAKREYRSNKNAENHRS